MRACPCVWLHVFGCIWLHVFGWMCWLHLSVCLPGCVGCVPTCAFPVYPPPSLRVHGHADTAHGPTFAWLWLQLTLGCRRF